MKHVAKRVSGNSKLMSVLLTLMLTFSIGMTPELFPDGEVKAENVPTVEDFFEYWGYQRLASQIGIPLTLEIKDVIESTKYPDLIKSLITVESSWYVDAVSPKDAVGLMQIRAIAAQEFEPEITERELFDPLLNVQLGIAIFEKNMAYFWAYEDIEHWALTSYNRGIYGTLSLGINPPETEYSKKVMELASQNHL